MFLYNANDEGKVKLYNVHLRGNSSSVDVGVSAHDNRIR